MKSSRPTDRPTDRLDEEHKSINSVASVWLSMMVALRMQRPNREHLHTIDWVHTHSVSIKGGSARKMFKIQKKEEEEVPIDGYQSYWI